MKSDLMFIVDNSMHSINKDYGKERLECQLEAVKHVVDLVFEQSVESTVGIMTLGRATTTKIVSPTSSKNDILSYFQTIQKDEFVHGGNSVLISSMALKYRTNPAQKIALFLSCPLEKDNLDLTVSAMEATLKKNISVCLILFGEALEYYNAFVKKLENFSEFACITVAPNQCFKQCVMSIIKEAEEEIDPELELAIKRSLEDSKHSAPE
ncbi:26S proteasome regulatory subunit N10 [Nematocida major]|uniref:26S proteasome regulatory subunit N10 n=1 Tax=Nematocida major TaxID=1912982 RepID=UPI002008A1B3|nr:26S proteasome regulatory subunit N10 [Nematocida major]KAH9385142.1 26S proteasome regulatory subunit N10 [Nematocida major]